MPIHFFSPHCIILECTQRLYKAAVRGKPDCICCIKCDRLVYAINNQDSDFLVGSRNLRLKLCCIVYLRVIFREISKVVPQDFLTFLDRDLAEKPSVSELLFRDQILYIYLETESTKAKNAFSVFLLLLHFCIRCD